MEIGFQYGLMGDKLTDQCKQQSLAFDPEKITRFQQQLDAMHVIRFADIVSDSQYDMMCKKFHRKLISYIAKANKMKITVK